MSFYSEFAGYYETVFPFDETVYAFLTSLLPKDTKRILDVGCGTGDYCGRFSNAGYKAVGLDLDPWMIERARRRYPAPEFHELGMEDIARVKGQFEAAWCIGNTASHLPQRKLPGFLGTVHDVLAPEGLWVVQTVNWDFILGHQSYEFPIVTVGSEGLKFERRYPEISEERVLFATRLTQGEEVVFEGHTELYPVRSAEYLALHQSAGFRSAGHYGSFERAAFDPAQPSSSVFAFIRN